MAPSRALKWPAGCLARHSRVPPESRPAPTLLAAQSLFAFHHVASRDRLGDQSQLHDVAALVADEQAGGLGWSASVRCSPLEQGPAGGAAARWTSWARVAGVRAGRQRFARVGSSGALSRASFSAVERVGSRVMRRCRAMVFGVASRICATEVLALRVTLDSIVPTGVRGGVNRGSLVSSVIPGAWAGRLISRVLSGRPTCHRACCAGAVESFRRRGCRCGLRDRRGLRCCRPRRLVDGARVARLRRDGRPRGGGVRCRPVALGLPELALP